MGKKILVVYFSGTGGTRKAAETVAGSISAHGCAVHLFSLDDLANSEKFNAMTAFLASADALVLLYAVHAFDAPEPVYSWIARLPDGLGRETGLQIPAMVLSVSGGGEGWPNTTCRQECIASLEKRGFRVDYEDMLIMPCNWVFTLDERLSLHLIRVLPGFADSLARKFLSGERHRLPTRKPDLLQKFIPPMEKKGVHKFPQSITVSSACTACAWCAAHCPTGNITMHADRPRFGDSCIACFRCIYGCPAHAMKSGNFMVLKKGFSFEKLEERLAVIERAGESDTTLGDYGKLVKGPLFKSLKKYLDRGYAALQGRDMPA